mgnify:CR=1 FL=1
MWISQRRASHCGLEKTARHMEILQGLTDRATACGLDVKMIDGKEVREINPFLSDEVIGASWCATDGHANPLLTTLGYYRAARRLGVQFFHRGRSCGASEGEGKAEKGCYAEKRLRGR